MIQITNVLTNERWNFPDPVGSANVYLGRYGLGPGRYDIRNGSAGFLVVIVADGVRANIPVGATWNVCTNENDRSYQPCPDFAVWPFSGRFN